MLEDICDGSKTHPNVNRKDALYKIRDCISQRKYEWKGALKDLFQPKTKHFFHALSFECTSKLCITLFNQFLVYFHIQKMHYTIESLNCVVRHFPPKNCTEIYYNHAHYYSY